ncbi:sugar ABC transporter permease [Arthrobacter sp. AD-310]
MSTTLSAPAEHREPETHPSRPSRSFRRWWRDLGWRHVVGILGAAVALFPLLYILSAALNPVGTVGGSLLPAQLSLENFETLFSGERGPFLRWMGNSLMVAAAVGAGQVLCSTLAAYAFSRFRFRGRRAGLLGVLLIQMFPQFLATVALFTLVADFGEVVPAVGLNTLLGYGLVLMGGSLAQVWLLKGFFDTLPREIDEAATLDGAGHARIFWQIVLPLARPVLAITALLSVIGVLGDFILSSIFLTDDSVKTLAVGLHGMVLGNQSENFGAFSAGCIVIAVPVIVLFLWLQRYIIGGLSAGSTK